MPKVNFRTERLSAWRACSGCFDAGLREYWQGFVVKGVVVVVVEVSVVVEGIFVVATWPAEWGSSQLEMEVTKWFHMVFILVTLLRIPRSWMRSYLSRNLFTNPFFLINVVKVLLIHLG